MSDEAYSFSTARVRLEEIVSQVRKKDTSLEKSLDLLEEGVRLANACTELIDHADWTAENPPESVDAAGAAVIGPALGTGVVAQAASDADSGASGDVETAVSALAEEPEDSGTEAADEDTESPAVDAHEAEASEDAADPDDDFGDADEAWTDEEPAGI